MFDAPHIEAARAIRRLPPRPAACLRDESRTLGFLFFLDPAAARRALVQTALGAFDRVRFTALVGTLDLAAVRA